jgi:hypothetical protein
VNLDPQNYGAALAAYKGTGILTLAEDKRAECEFVAVQLINGKIVILGSASDFSLGFRSDDPEIMQLSGQTEDGYLLHAVQFFVSGIESRWSIDSGGASDFRFIVSKLDIQHHTPLQLRP